MVLTREEWAREFFTSHVEYLSKLTVIGLNKSLVNSLKSVKFSSINHLKPQPIVR